MKNLSDVFAKFADDQRAVATAPSTLTFCFALSAVCYPFSYSAAIGAAAAPTIWAGATLVLLGASKVLTTIAPPR